MSNWQNTPNLNGAPVMLEFVITRTVPVTVAHVEGREAFSHHETLAANPYNDVAQATPFSYWRDGWFAGRYNATH